MSITNTVERQRDNPHSFYRTPAKCVRALLSVVDLPWHGQWLEPCAGDGAIIKACERHWTKTSYQESVQWSAVELQQKFMKPLSALVPMRRLHMEDAMGYLKRSRTHWEVALTNPAFPLAEDLFLALRPKCEYLVLLLRIGFLEAKSRQRYLQNDMPDLYILSPRPSFEKGRSDLSTYAWMVWGPKRKRKGSVETIDTSRF